MKLSEADSDLFFDLLWSLHFFANNQLGIHKNIDSIDAYKKLPQEDKLEVRKFLFENTNIIKQYIKENPDKYDDEKISIVSGWVNFKKSEFHIERYLKNYAIFIADEAVYAVVGLQQGFDEMIHKSYLPLYTKAILLPFKGKIIYDGILESYNVHFGGSIKNDLKEIYMRAKQNGRIITALEKNSNTYKKPKKAQTKKPVQWTQEIEQLSGIAKNLKGGKGQPEINGALFSLIRASMALADKVIIEEGGYDDIYKDFQKLERTFKKLTTVVERMD